MTKDELKNIYYDCRISIDNIPESILIYLPTHKFDFEKIKLLENTKKDKLIPLLPFLLSWLQDMNWPIACLMSDFLLVFNKEIISEIRWILEGKDEQWKSNCIEFLLKKYPNNVTLSLKDILIRIANTPSEEEKKYEIDEIANEVLANQ